MAIVPPEGPTLQISRRKLSEADITAILRDTELLTLTQGRYTGNPDVVAIAAKHRCGKTDVGDVLAGKRRAGRSHRLRVHTPEDMAARTQSLPASLSFRQQANRLQIPRIPFGRLMKQLAEAGQREEKPR
ncbi:hypothetical protein F443_15946 [Phytophthora nicotianae P1569]|uniref:Uncharacterized protein n=1 Tax=Phytophthora nicotianae P1569 TaxID=1317065 RepID=V9EGD8_PHYNI|nr:hypothetical protein F443_15946 [Phytophthora nicotianae P1569]